MNQVHPDNPRAPTDARGSRCTTRQSLFALLDNIPLPSLLHNGKVVCHANPAAAQLCGTEHAAQLTGRPIAALLPRDAQSLTAEQASDSSPPTTRLQRVDGQIVDVALQESTIESEGGALVHVLLRGIPREGVSGGEDMDIPSQAEPAFSAEKHKPRTRLHALGESSPDSMALINADGEIVYLNRTNTPAPIDAFIGANVFSLLREPDGSRFQACVERVRRTGKIDQCTVWYHDTDGTVRLFETRVCPVIRRGHVTAFAINAHEITGTQPDDPHMTGPLDTEPQQAGLEQVEAMRQDAVATAEPTAADGALVRALRRAHDELLHVTASVSAGLWSLRVSADGQWSDFYRSPVTETIMGRPLKSVGESPDHWLATVHQEDQSSVLEAIDRLLRCAPTCDEAEYRIRLPDGTFKWVRNSTNARRLPDGSVRLDGVLADITDRKAAESALRESDEQLRWHQDELAHAGRLSTMGELVASIAHEINQPLYAIANYAGACQNALNDVSVNDASAEEIDRVARWTQEIAAQSRRAGEIIARLGNFVRKSPPHRSTVNINNLVIDSLDLLRFETRRHQVRVGIELAPPVPRVLADRVQIQQVLVNLIRNAFDALEFVPVAQRRVAIAIEAQAARICVHVEDGGKGLTLDEHAMLFEPFFTTKERGMGMGLAISRSIIESHGGRLWATTNPDRGTTFHFELPAHEVD